MQNEPFDQLDPNPPKSKMLLGKVVPINFAIMLAYLLFFWIHKDESTVFSGLEDFVRGTILLGIQVGLNLFIGLVLVFNPKYKHLGLAMFLGGVITAVVGAVTIFVTEDYF